MLLAIAAVAASCVNDVGSNSDFGKYADWEEANTKWFEQQKTLLDANGKPYYTEVPATWDSSSKVLMHWFNDTTKTKGNLKPLYTSTVDVKYRGQLYDSTPFDSSYLRTSPGDSIARFQLNGVVEGWQVAITRMHVGDSCRIVVPYALGYGSSTQGAIKPYSMLQFDVALKGIYKYETK